MPIGLSTTEPFLGVLCNIIISFIRVSLPFKWKECFVLSALRQNKTLMLHCYSMWLYNVNVPFRFRSIFIERFDRCKQRCTHRSTVPILHTASEGLQNIMISWAMEQLDTGETTLAFVELWNERSQTRVAIEFDRWIVWKRSVLLSFPLDSRSVRFSIVLKKKR